MPTLALLPGFTPDTMAVAAAAQAEGWEVERLSSWRVPDWLKGREIVLFGVPPTGHSFCGRP